MIVDICFLDKLNSIPLLQPFIDSMEIKMFSIVYNMMAFIKGIYVKNLRKFAKFVGGGYGVSVTYGTAVIELALASLGIGKGDKVLPNFTFGLP